MTIIFKFLREKETKNKWPWVVQPFSSSFMHSKRLNSGDQIFPFLDLVQLFKFRSEFQTSFKPYPFIFKFLSPKFSPIYSQDLASQFQDWPPLIFNLHTLSTSSPINPNLKHYPLHLTLGGSKLHMIGNWWEVHRRRNEERRATVDEKGIGTRVRSYMWWRRRCGWKQSVGWSNSMEISRLDIKNFLRSKEKTFNSLKFL